MAYDPAERARRDYQMNQQTRMREAAEFKHWQDQQRYNNHLAWERKEDDERRRRAQSVK